jgi:hypothetical protein
MRRRLFLSILGLLMALLWAAPVAAADPTERPLTAPEQRAGERRIAAAERYLAQADANLGLAALACPVSTTDASTATADCEPPSGTLSVEARDQIKNIYCGPATGQVIANYTWAMGPGANKYTQDQIAAWMKTNIHGGTDAPNLEIGLERATIGAPRRPANWDWVVIGLSDRNGNGLVGDELHGYARSNVSGSRMPLAVPVKPHEPGAGTFLSSWPREVRSVGHWIPIYGWIGIYDGTDSAKLRYTDSSRDEGGSTGKFIDPTRHIAILMMQHTRRLVW